MRPSRFIGILLCPALVILPRALPAATLHVPAQYPTIQAGVDAASHGDSVLVAPGTYSGPGNRDIDFAGKSIVVKSEAGAEATIIDCQGSQGDPHRGFFFHNGETTASVVQGLTIKHGVETDPEPYDRGGAILCEYSSPTIKECHVDSCGAIYAGGILCWYSSATVERNTVTACSSTGWGGGIGCYASAATIDENWVEGSSSNSGGGIACVGEPHAVLEANTVVRNYSRCHGGGVSCLYSSPSLTANTITQNYCAAADTQGGGGIACLWGSRPAVENSIVWGNSSSTPARDIWVGDSSSLSLRCSDAYVLDHGSGEVVLIGWNISKDPLFCEPDNDWCNPDQNEFTLHSDSPCGADSSHGCGLIGAWPVDCCAAATAPDRPDRPNDFNLALVCSNPFRPPDRMTYIVLGPPSGQEILLRIYDPTGRVVRTLVNEPWTPGTHDVVWDGLDDGGGSVANGLYLFELAVGGEKRGSRVVLVR